MNGNLAKKIFLVFLFALLIFITLEIVLDIYIDYFADEEFLTHYASIRQLAKRFNRDKNTLRLKSHLYTIYSLSPNFEKGCNRHNAYGFRGAELGEKRKDEVWIVCVGESTTYDYYIPCWKNTYPAQLEKYLNNNGVKAKVINAGVDGWTSFEVLIDFALRITRFPVDIVIYYGGFNDINYMRMVYPIPENVSGRGITYVRGGVDRMVNYPIWESSSLIRMCLVKMGYTIPHFDLFSLHLGEHNRFIEFITQLLKGNYPSGIFREVPIETILQMNPPIWFEQNLENFVLLAKSKFISPVMTTYILNNSDKNSHFVVESKSAVEKLHKVIKPAVNEMNTVIRRISDKYNVPCLDLSAIYPVDGDLFVDLVHNNEQGARIKAELIGEFLINAGLVNIPPNKD